MKRKTKISNKNILTNVVKVVVNERKKRGKNKGKSKSKTILKPQQIEYQQPQRSNISNLETSFYTDTIKNLKKELSKQLSQTLYEPTKDTTKTLSEPIYKDSDFSGPTAFDLLSMSPGTITTKGIEEMKAFLKLNKELIPTIKIHTDEEIDRLQPNKISEYYESVKNKLSTGL